DATAAPVFAVDGDEHVEQYVLRRNAAGYRLARVLLDGTHRESGSGSDLTRPVTATGPGTPVEPVPGQRPVLPDHDLSAWTALGFALTSADLAGAMRGVLDVTVAYAAERRQFGVPVGSFQAVQHLLAEARCLMEGSVSVALHASWAVDNLEPDAARSAGR